MGARGSLYECDDCSSGRVLFLDEEDLDAHAMSVHWCQECVSAHRQPAPFSSYRELQEHILCGCASLSGLASRTRGMSIYDTSSSSHNIRKRFLPESFEGHQYAGLSTEFNPNDGSNATRHKRNNWSVGSSVDLASGAATTPAPASDLGADGQPPPDHCYFFDVVVPGSEIFEEDEVMGAATTICLEAAAQILRGRLVSKQLCDEIINKALVSDEAERNRSISAVYMRPQYRENLEVLVDKRGCKLVCYVEPGARGYPSGRFTPSGSMDHTSLDEASIAGSPTAAESGGSIHGRTATVLPPDWRETVDKEGSKLYSHETSGMESYERPPGSLKPTSFKVPKGVGSWGAPLRPGSVDAAMAPREAFLMADQRTSPRGSSSSRSASVNTNASGASGASSADHGAGQLVQCFNMASIYKLQEYSKTQPLVAMLSRSPNTSLLLFFDQQGRATVFLPFVESCSNCAFFGFDTHFDDDFSLEALQLQLQEEFPVMTEADAVYSLRKHWNEFRMTVFRLDRSVRIEGSSLQSREEIKIDDDEGGDGYSTVRDGSRDPGVYGREGGRTSRATFMTDLDGHSRPSVMGIFSGDKDDGVRKLGGGTAWEAPPQPEQPGQPGQQNWQKRSTSHRHSRLTSTDLRVRVEAFRSSSMASISMSPQKVLSPQKSVKTAHKNAKSPRTAKMPSLSSAMVPKEKQTLKQLSQVVEENNEEGEEGEEGDDDDTSVYSTDRGTFSSSASSATPSLTSVVSQLREENDDLRGKLAALTEEMIGLRLENAELRRRGM